MKKEKSSCCSGCLNPCGQDLIRQILTNEVGMALGCTELGALALAAAHARRHCLGEIQSANCLASDDVYLNGSTAGIPGTNGKIGLKRTIALGFLSNSQSDDLTVLKCIVDENLAEELIPKITVKHKNSEELFIEINLITDQEQCIVRITKNHNNISYCSVCKQEEIYREKENEDSSSYQEKLRQTSLMQLIEMAENASSDCLQYVQQGITQNLQATEIFNSENSKPFNLGGIKPSDEIILGLASQVGQRVATATSARMMGENFEVMSSGGSGNQGVIAIVVPSLIGEYAKAETAMIQKGVLLSHIVNAKIKAHMGLTSAQCGCGVAASVGATIASIYILTKNENPEATYKQMGRAINYLVAGLAGMVCDGAKLGCSVKVKVSAMIAVEAVYLSYNENFPFDKLGGIVNSDPNITIQNLARLTKAMAPITKEVLSILEESGDK